MSIQNMLQQLLANVPSSLTGQSGQNQGQNPNSPPASGGNSPLGGLGDSLGGGLGKLGSGLGGNLGSFGGGALVGSLMGVLLGRSKLGKTAGKVARYGGAAALGAAALGTYQAWQRKQQSGQAQAQPVAQPGAQPIPQAQPYTTAPVQPYAAPVAALPPLDESHSRSLVAAIIAAANADGHISPDEQEHLQAGFAQLADSPEERAWIQAELQRPADPVLVARAVRSPAHAAELYLASVLVVDEAAPAERQYLDALARELRLAPDLQRALESQASDAKR